MPKYTIEFTVFKDFFSEDVVSYSNKTNLTGRRKEGEKMKLLNFLLPLFFILCLNSLVFSQSIATVTAENANLRGTPTNKGKIVDTLPKDTLLEVFQQKGVWYLVQAQDYVGWIHGNIIALKDSEEFADKPSGKTDLKDPASRKNNSNQKTYIRGPRGGCYYINSNGNKTYVNRSLCN